jgi:hypothetical protein
MQRRRRRKDLPIENNYENLQPFDAAFAEIQLFSADWRIGRFSIFSEEFPNHTKEIAVYAPQVR